MKLLPLLPFPILAHAAHLHISGQHLRTARRSALSGSMTTLADSQNIVYTTNISLNNAQFSVMIDTGSSDLWVSPPVPNPEPQNFQAEVSYASGSASGDVLSATLRFAGFSIPSQFFIQAPDGNAAAGADGLIGLGPSSGSDIRAEGNTSAANPPLDRIFASNSSVEPFIAVLLQRADDPAERYPGDLSVGEVLSNYQSILSQPQLPVPLVPLGGAQHWQTYLDVNGLIVNGKQVDIKTQVTGAQKPNATVVFDTGFTLPQVSPDVAQALYGNIPGAALKNVSSLGVVWTLPCDQLVNATFLFAGVEFPIHPLDLNSDEADLDSGCVGTFQPYSFDIEEGGEILFDMVLGMAFLRNAYLLINFGNLVNATTPSSSTAFIQMLPTTNATQAAQDFVSVRSGDGDGNDANDNELLNTKHSSSSGSFLKHGLIGLIVAAVVLLILAVALIACCRRRRSKQNLSQSTAWPANPPSYRPINDPSPQAAYDIHMAPGTRPGYNPAPEYQTAWDARY